MKLVLDGNIGCGKSTIIKKIIENNPFDLTVYNEPLKDWDEWLKLFYSDMSKYSFGFQMRVLKSHLNNKNIQSGIFERSPLSCQEVFGKLLHEDGLMNDLEWDLTQEFQKDYGWIPNLVIYLRCDPETCLERIKQRNRTSENTISLDYLKRLHEKYENIYVKNPDTNMQIIQIDSTNTIDQVYKQMLEQIDSLDP
jgi:deoxycitidine kinase/deoxyguanosine kinase